MAELNAREFYRLFIKEVYPERIVDGKPLMEYYRNDASYTPVIIRILNEIIESFGYTHQNEYFRIDVVGWTTHYQDMETDAINEGLRIKPHLWDLKIAVEHENSKTDWSDEVMKLIHVKCPLKVIIGYCHYDERTNMDIDRKSLSFIARWMERVDAFRLGEGNEAYLVILGNGCNRKRGKPNYNSFDYVGYLYNWNSQEFERVLV